jgi:DNA-binding MarR family transcriptional regulator
MQQLGIYNPKLLLDETVFLTEEIKDSLQKQYQRLSNLEKQIMSLLAQENAPISLVKLLEKSMISYSELVNALQSLSQRCLLEQKTENYQLSPILKEYIKSYL